MLATEFDRKTLDITTARDALIFDLQNAADCLARYGSRRGMVRSVAQNLVQSGVYNSAELSRLILDCEPDLYKWHGALNRSLLQQF